MAWRYGGWREPARTCTIDGVDGVDDGLNGGDDEIYLAGGCLWGVQAFVATLPGVSFTEAGRANGERGTLNGPYDGYVECVRTRFAADVIPVGRLVQHLFEIIDPYSVDRQGPDVGRKYRTGVYSEDPAHLRAARAVIDARDDADRVAVEVLPLTGYVRSAEEHQHRLARHPEDSCHLPHKLLTRYVPLRDHPRRLV